MTTVSIVLFLVLAVVISSVLSRMLPVAIPRPVVQIVVGAAIGLVSHLRVELDPALFFLVFLPPLLFLDGWRVPTEDLYANRSTIIELALGLVVFTVLGVGFLIHLMIPTMPLPVAFALAAVVSPTDPIAVSAIARRVSIPKRVMRILEGESLLNDASGLVCLRFAIAAALSGTFSLARASVTFLWLAIGGLLVGAIIVVVIDRAHRLITRHLADDAGSQILTTLLIPFAAYLVAEELHCSGILAAVSAGVTLSILEESGRERPTARVGGTAVWNVVQVAANGIIFVLLGEQIPQIVMSAITDVQLSGARNPWWLAVYVVAVAGALALLRFVWVWLSLQLSRFGGRERGRAARAANWKLVAAISVAGVRGAVTLAAVLTFPFAMPNGAPFPERPVAVFIAAGVILLSLATATIALPYLLKGIQLPATSASEVERSAASASAAKAAIRSLQRATAGLSKEQADVDIYMTVATRIIDTYRARLARRSESEGDDTVSRVTAEAERELWSTALQAERDEIFRRIRERQLASDTGMKMVHELDLREASYRT